MTHQIYDCTARVAPPPSTAPARARRVSATDLRQFDAAYYVFALSPPPPNTVEPGSAHIAYVPSQRTSWGVATFPDTHQDTPQIMIFARPSGCPWTYVGYANVPFPCPGQTDAPPRVVAAWKLPAPSPEACRNQIDPPTPR